MGLISDTTTVDFFFFLPLSHIYMCIENVIEIFSQYKSARMFAAVFPWKSAIFNYDCPAVAVSLFVIHGFS